MGVVGIIQARMGSSRLPNKVLMEVGGRPILGHIIMRLKAVKSLDSIIVATTTEPADKAIIEVAKRYGVESFSGSRDDVLVRFLEAIEGLEVETIIRATADNPLVDPWITQELITTHLESNLDYTVMEGLPLGITTEVVSKTTLLKIHSLLEKKSPHREHVTSFIHKNPNLFKIKILKAPIHLRRPNYRLTVDTEEDLELIRAIFSRLNKQGEILPLIDIIKLLDRDPKLLEINAKIQQRVVDG